MPTSLPATSLAIGEGWLPDAGWRRIACIALAAVALLSLLAIERLCRRP